MLCASWQSGGRMYRFELRRSEKVSLTLQSLEAYFVLIAASIPTLRPLVHRRRDSRTKSSRANHMNSWLAGYHKRSANSSGKTRGQFLELSDFHDQIRGHESCVIPPTYRNGAYHSESTISTAKNLVEDAIKKQTNISVTYEKASRLEEGPSTCPQLGIQA